MTAGHPAHPFRRVVRTVPTGPHTAYDELECGHRFTWLDYYNPGGWHPKRRRCVQCEPEGPPKRRAAVSRLKPPRR